jgi:predicted Holliday junction resolvase-like endonuclease
MLEELIILILIIVLITILISYIRLRGCLEERARTLFNTWRDRELASLSHRLHVEMEETIGREVQFQSREWQKKEEERIRQDAIRRSREVIHGKVTEHLIPYFPAFPWNPSDARFLGSPIDFIVFDGLSEGKVREIVLVEVKSGVTKSLSQRERSVRQCTEKRSISFRVIHPDEQNH